MKKPHMWLRHWFYLPSEHLRIKCLVLVVPSSQFSFNLVLVNCEREDFATTMSLCRSILGQKRISLVPHFRNTVLDTGRLDLKKRRRKTIPGDSSPRLNVKDAEFFAKTMFAQTSIDIHAVIFERGDGRILSHKLKFSISG